jgi:hypothetical protein
VSIEDFCALQEHDQRVHNIFDLLPTHAFLKQFLKTVLIQIFNTRITLILYFLNIFYTFTNNFLYIPMTYFVKEELSFLLQS